MDPTTALGIVAGLLMIGLAILVSGASLGAYVDIPSVLITVGGAVCATIVNFPLHRLMETAKVVKVAFVQRLEDPGEIIRRMVGFAEKARREGLLALEESVDKINDPFLKKGVQLVVDGTDPALVKDILETDLAFLEDRHKQGAKVVVALAQYAPAFGMIGTLVGLIQMLRKIDEPSKIGPAMAVALITTLYGAMLAYLVFTPIAGKLELRSSEEVLRKEMTLEGILAIQSGDNPRIVEEKLRAYLAPKLRAKYENTRAGASRTGAGEAARQVAAVGAAGGKVGRGRG